MLAKNRFAGKTLKAKGTPSLELQAILLGVETLANVKEELAGNACVNPIKFTDFKLFSDSSVCLSWIESYAKNFDKMNSKTIFVKNRLSKIISVCDKFPITFVFLCWRKKSRRRYH